MTVGEQASGLLRAGGAPHQRAIQLPNTHTAINSNQNSSSIKHRPTWTAVDIRLLMLTKCWVTRAYLHHDRDSVHITQRSSTAPRTQILTEPQRVAAVQTVGLLHQIHSEPASSQLHSPDMTARRQPWWPRCSPPARCSVRSFLRHSHNQHTGTRMHGHAPPADWRCTD